MDWSWDNEDKAAQWCLVLVQADSEVLLHMFFNHIWAWPISDSQAVHVDKTALSQCVNTNIQ